MSSHVALLGDSIFDNGSYTTGEPDVVTHLRSLLPAGWESTLIAVDGSTTNELAAQLRMLPEGVTHLVISIGGNDALLNADMLDLPASSTAHALGIFARRLAVFQASYTAAIDAALDLDLPTTVCTIYNGAFEPIQAQRVNVALPMFNDVILRTAFSRGLPVIDLGLVCADPDDYFEEIEPSGQGGLKIARMIAASLNPAALTSRVHACLPPSS
jgi:hypothetical protein